MRDPASRNCVACESCSVARDPQLSIYLFICRTAVVEHPLGADEVGAQLGHLVRVRGRGKGKVRIRLERSLAT